MFDVFAELVPGKEMDRPCLKSSALMNFTDVVLPYISAESAWFSRLFSLFQVVSGKSPLGLWLWDMAKQRRSAALHFLGGTAAAESGWGLDAVSVLCQPAPKQAEAWQRDSSIGDGHDAHDVHDMQMSLSKSIGWSLVSNQLSLLQIACWDISILRLQCFEDLHRTHHSHPHHAGSSMPGMCWSCLGQSHHARKRKSR